jgi:uncharacterized protein YcfJ
MKTKTALLLAGMIASGSAVAGNHYQSDSTYYTQGDVLKAKPLYETVQINHPEERCWNERVRHRGHRKNNSHTPMIAGAILGGVVGNQFGKGSGKDAMTAAGVLLGGSIGNDMGRQRHGRGYTTLEQRCETINNFTEKQELVGYRVKYRYDGKVYWTRTDVHPGRYINLKVSVAPTTGPGYNFLEDD